MAIVGGGYTGLAAARALARRGADVTVLERHTIGWGASSRNGGEAAAAVDPDLERYMHLAALNRGILLTPFHNMALLAPAVTAADVDHHTNVFRESVAAEGLFH